MKIVNQKNQVFNIHPDFEYDVDKHIQKGNHRIVDELVKFQQGGDVSSLWVKKTGTDWSEAKKQGLTDGSYEGNMKLRANLLSQQPKVDTLQVSSYKEAPDFSTAFTLARKELGANKIFEYNGRKYGTNVAGEEFNPSDEELNQYGINNEEVKQRLTSQNKMVTSPYTSKEVTKLEPEYKNWETLKRRNQEINKMKDAEKIVQYQSKNKDEQYLVVDKKSARMHLYKGDKLVDSFEVGVGENKGDAQTVTKVKDGKTDWTAGNKQTGAGTYTISNINPNSKEYYGLPSFNLTNEQGIEVATSIHGTPKSRRAKLGNATTEDNRMSNGCINGKCQDLEAMYSKYNVTKGTKVYVLPEDEGNRFEMQDGKLILRVNAQNRQKALEYVDSKGEKQKGQGINQSVNTLNYKPIKAFINKTAFEKDVYQWNDTNDDKEYESTTKPFMQSLVSNKQKVMKAAKIPSDVYNEIARMSFGIYGTESNFGDTHSAVGNFARAVNKAIDSKSSSSPDYKAKATTYGADEDNRSVGLTQIRFSYLNEDEKKALKEVGVTSNKDFLDPKKAAIGTVVVLGVRYNQQLNDNQKKDMWKHLPTKWNRRDNYADRVKNNSKYLTLKQLE